MKKTYSLLFSLLCFLCGGGSICAETITTSAQIVAGQIYQIRAKETGRGALNASDLTGNAAHAEGHLSAAGTTRYTSLDGYRDFKNVAVSEDNVYQQFAFIQIDDQYYLYNVGARAFCYTSSDKGLFSKTQSEPGTLTAVTSSGNTAYTVLTFTTNNRSLTFSNGGGQHAINMKTGITASASDGGDILSVTVLSGKTLSAAELNYAKSLILLPQAKAVLALSTENQVGYPSPTARALLNSAISSIEAKQNSSEEITDAELTQLVNDTTTYKTTSDINMPVDGKAYWIYACSPNGEERPLYCTGTRVTGNVNTSAITNYLSDNNIWVCHKTSESDPSKCLFVSHTGVYLNWFCDDASKGLNTTGCDASFNETYHVWTMERATTDPRGGTINPVPTTNQLFGCFQMKGNGKSNKTYYLIARNNAAGTNSGVTTFHAGNANNKYYMSDNQNTYLFKLKEVPYYNTVRFQTPVTADGNDYATVYLPFAYNVPTGATAYTATTGEGVMSLTPVEGGVVAKNQAVVMITPTSNHLGTVEVTPAITVGVTDRNNALKGTVSETETPTGAYVLNGGSGSIGFYPYSAPNLPKGRAYIELPSSSAPALHFLFEGETTGVSSIENAASDVEAVYYDLSGRRVKNPVKGSFYISNGKKVIR